VNIAQKRAVQGYVESMFVGALPQAGYAVNSLTSAHARHFEVL